MMLPFNYRDDVRRVFELSLERYDTLMSTEDWSDDNQSSDGAVDKVDDEQPESEKEEEMNREEAKDEEEEEEEEDDDDEEEEEEEGEGKTTHNSPGLDLSMSVTTLLGTPTTQGRQARHDYLVSHNLDSSDDEYDLDHHGHSTSSSRQSPYLTPTGVLSVSSLIPPNDQLKAIPRSQLSKQYPNSLVLKYLDKGSLSLTYMNHHRNNLTTSSNHHNMVFVAAYSEIHVFDVNPATGVLNQTPRFRFDTKPSVIEASMTRGANWPSDPHGINFLKVGLLSGQEVLASASDNGQVLLWFVDDFLKLMDQPISIADHLGPQIYPFPSISNMPPKIIIKQTQSTWGIDFHNELKLLAVSDNSHHVYIYFLDHYMAQIAINDLTQFKVLNDSIIFEPEARNPIISPRMTHNIPDVCFINDSEYERVKQAFFISCISIMGEVSLWEYYFTTNPDDNTIRVDVNSVYGGITGERHHRSHGNPPTNRNRHHNHNHNNNNVDPHNIIPPYMNAVILQAGGAPVDLNYAFDPTRFDPQGLADGDESFTSDDMLSFVTESDVLQAHTEASAAANNPNDSDHSSSYDDMENYDSTDSSNFDEDSDEDTQNNRNYHHDEYLADMDGIWRYCYNIGQRGWSINYVNASDFKEVDSLYEVTGNKWYDEDSHFGQMERDTARLLEIDKNQPKPQCSPTRPYTIPKVTTLPIDHTNVMNPSYSDRAIKRKIQIQRISENCMNRFSYFEILSLPIQPRASVLASFSNEQHYLLPICRKRKEKKQKFIHRLRAQLIHKQRLLSCEKPLTATERYNLEKKIERMELASVLNDKFVVLTTKKSLYLCRANDLYCNGACSNVFSWEYQFGSESVYFDILSITEVIPELSAVIVASHIGSVALYRMVKYRGIYNLRQEYRFPDPEHSLFANSDEDGITGSPGTGRRNAIAGVSSNESVIAGISVKRVQMGGVDEKPDKRFGDIEVGTRKYKLFVFYIGGKFLTYEITRKEGKEDLIVENIVF